MSFRGVEQSETTRNLLFGWDKQVPHPPRFALRVRNDRRR
jgi:hypothetical protein